jgi:hypothetical protein
VGCRCRLRIESCTEDTAVRSPPLSRHSVLGIAISKLINTTRGRPVYKSKDEPICAKRTGIVLEEASGFV